MTFFGVLYLIFLVGIFTYSIIAKIQEVKEVHEYKKNNTKMVNQEIKIDFKKEDITTKNLEKSINEIFNNDKGYKLLFDSENIGQDIYSKKAIKRVIDDLYGKVIIENERDIYNLFVECITNMNDYDMSNTQTIIASFYKKWFFIHAVAEIYNVSLFENDNWNIERDLKNGVIPNDFGHVLTLLATLVIQMGDLCYVRATSQLKMTQEKYNELVNYLLRKIELLLCSLENRMLLANEQVIELERLIIGQISEDKQFDMPDGSNVYMFNLNKQKKDMFKKVSIIFIKTFGREYFNEKFIDELVFEKIYKANTSSEKGIIQSWYREINLLNRLPMFNNEIPGVRWGNNDFLACLPIVFECRQILVVLANSYDIELYQHPHIPTEEEIKDILSKEHEKGNLVDYEQLIMSSAFTAIQYVLSNCMDYINEREEDSYLEMKKSFKELLKYGEKLITMFDDDLDINITALKNSLAYY